MGHIKLWDNILDCPKVHKLSHLAFRCWIKLLVTALRNGGRNGELPLLETLAFRLRMTCDQIESSIKEMHQCGLLEPCEDNPIGGMPWRIHDWDEWQMPKDPGAALRQARWRDKQALRNAQRNGVSNDDVTHNITPTSIEGLKVEVKPPNPLSRGKPAKPAFVLPDWIPQQDWDDWLAMRLRIRKPATDRAKELAVIELRKLSEKGDPPGLVLQRSIQNCWTDVWPLKSRENGTGKHKKPEPSGPAPILYDTPERIEAGKASEARSAARLAAALEEAKLRKEGKL